MADASGDETAQNRLKRLHMRSWRRGIKEMDIILGGFADTELPGLSPAQLDLYEALLGENDHDLYAWVTSRIGDSAKAPAGPAPYAALLDDIARHAAARL